MRNELIPDADVEAALPESFWAKVMPEPNSGCWIWIGASNITGYGQFGHRGKVRTAHRVIYETLFGPQLGLEIDHLCHIPACVNPSHLEAVTKQENNRRRRKSELGKGNRKKTHCPNGHPLSGSNLETRIQRNGWHQRRCIICRNANQRKYNKKQRACQCVS